MRPQPARSRGARPPAGAMPHFASTTSAAHSSRPRCSEPARCSSSAVAGLDLSRSRTRGSPSGRRRGPAARRPLGNRDPGRPGRARPLARADPRDPRKLPGHARDRRRRRRDVPRPPGRELADPRRHRRGGNRKRAGRARSSASACDRRRGASSVRGVRRPHVAPEATPAPSTTITSRASDDSTIAPGIPPCATNHARGAIALLPCRAPSARASGTGSAERLGGPRRW